MEGGKRHVQSRLGPPLTANGLGKASTEHLSGTFAAICFGSPMVGTVTEEVHAAEESGEWRGGPLRLAHQQWSHKALDIVAGREGGPPVCLTALPPPPLAARRRRRRQAAEGGPRPSSAVAHHPPQPAQRGEPCCVACAICGLTALPPLRNCRPLRPSPSAPGVREGMVLALPMPSRPLLLLDG